MISGTILFLLFSVFYVFLYIYTEEKILLRLQLTLFKTFINTALPTSFNIISYRSDFIIHSEILEEEKSVQNKYLNMAVILNKHAVEHLPKGL